MRPLRELDQCAVGPLGLEPPIEQRDPTGQDVIRREPFAAQQTTELVSVPQAEARCESVGGGDAAIVAPWVESQGKDRRSADARGSWGIRSTFRCAFSSSPAPGCA